MLVLFCHFYFLWKILLANNVDPDQMPHYVVSDLGLHCLPMTLLQVSRSEWVKIPKLKIVKFANSVAMDEVACNGLLHLDLRWSLIIYFMI